MACELWDKHQYPIRLLGAGIRFRGPDEREDQLNLLLLIGSNHEGHIISFNSVSRPRRNFQTYSSIMGSHDIPIIIPHYFSKEEIQRYRDQLPRKEDPFQGNSLLGLLTSGSSGEPSLIFHRRSGIEESARSTLDFYSVKKGDSWGLNLPCDHIGGLMILFRMNIIEGEVVDLKHPDRHVEYLSLVPTQLDRMIQEDKISFLRARKKILVGGAPLSKELFLGRSVWGLIFL